MTEDVDQSVSARHGAYEDPLRAERGMSLLTRELIKKLPGPHGQEKLGYDAMIHVKLFTPSSSWTWYITEFDPETKWCFGLVDGHEKELGSFSLAELETLRGPMGLLVERDTWWEPKTIREVLDGAP